MARDFPDHRPGTPRRVIQAAFTTASPDTLGAMPLDVLFDFARVHVIGDQAVDSDLRIDFTFTDLDQTWTLWIKRGVLNARCPNGDRSQLRPSSMDKWIDLLITCGGPAGRHSTAD